MATILIVDDLKRNRTSLVTHLSDQGHRLLEAANGSEGLIAVRAEHPDLVITDVLMPVMDGYEFVRQVRLDPTTAAIPVLFYTAPYGEREARGQALANGIAYVLTKPAEAEEVLKVVRSVLAGESLPAPPLGVLSLSSRFDRGHLGLLTDKLSEKVGDLRIANARLRAVVNIGLELSSHHDSEGLLKNVCHEACDLFGATYVTLGIVDMNDHTVRRVVTWGADASWIAIGDTASGILAEVIANRRTARGDAAEGEPLQRMFPLHHPEVQSFLAAPITSVDCAYGWICLVGNEGRTFTEGDEHLLMALSAQVGRLYEVEHGAIERRQAESSLRLERDRAQRFLDTAEVMLLALDVDGRITLVNRSGCALLGWTAPELVGRDWIAAFVPERQRDAARKTLSGLLGGAPSSSENLIQTRSGDERLIEWRHTVLCDDAGAVVGTLSSGTDVTERRTLEEQYQQAQKMEAIGRLAGGVAHDFNNLLTVILGYCELLLTDLDVDEVRQRDLAEIQKAGARAAGLTRQLLAFSRKEIIQPTLLDLNMVVTDMRVMLGRLIREDVKVVLSHPLQLSMVKADRGQVEQIVMNLAVNAQDAMPKGGTLTIETANAELDEDYARTHLAVRPGSYVALTITDTGTGIMPDVLPRLFEPFFTTKEAGKGTGLGLATVHSIAARHSGSVCVYSEIGRGTSFRVYFPISDAPQAQVSEIVAPAAVAQALAGETVLVVEDAHALRELTRKLLQRQGYTVLVAANADEALQVFDGNAAIDVVLTDVVMPGASGHDLARQLIQRRPAVKVIYMSGYTEDAIVQHGVLKPGIAFLHKPFTSDTLGRKVRDVLDRIPGHPAGGTVETLDG